MYQKLYQNLYQKPRERQELRELMKESGRSLLAGGTDLMPLVKNGVKKPEAYLDIREVPELKSIKKAKSHWFIGAGVTLTEMEEHETLAAELPALHHAAAETASLQIRNIGTIGGNIMQDRRCIYFNQSEFWRSSIKKCFKTGGCLCHQIPKSEDCRALYYSDLSVVLYAYEAEALIWENGQEKTVSIKELVEKHTRMNGTVEPEHILVEGFRIPVPSETVKSAFEKISIRSSIDFPVIHFAGCYDVRTRVACLFAGAIAEAPVELTETETLLQDGVTELEELTTAAVREVKEKSRLVKEAGLSVKVKRDAFLNVRFLIEKLLS